MRRITMFFTIAAGLMIIASVVATSVQSSPDVGPTLRIHVIPEEVVVGSNRIRMAVSNSSCERTVVLLGSYSGCADNCCYSPANSARITILPGSEAMYECDLKVYSAGPFAAKAELFVDEGGLRTYLVPLTGTAIATTVGGK